MKGPCVSAQGCDHRAQEGAVLSGQGREKAAKGAPGISRTRRNLAATGPESARHGRKACGGKEKPVLLLLEHREDEPDPAHDATLLSAKGRRAFTRFVAPRQYVIAGATNRVRYSAPARPTNRAGLWRGR
jgi:hypothetical protein